MPPPKTAMDDFRMPPCAQTLGWRLLDADVARGWARIGFEGRPEFLNPAGVVQGGFLAAMLDDAMGPALLIHSEGALYTSTIDLHVSYLAPVAAGAITVEAQVVRMGKTIAFMEASLFDGEGRLAAKATASARVVPMAKAGAARA